jgi:YfiH family protein
MQQVGAIDVIRPDWPAPALVRACSTTRCGGISESPFDSLNLGGNTEDSPAAVAENRHRLRESLHLPAEPAWLQQVHGIEVVCAEAGSACADAVWTARPGTVCAVLTADCLPVLLCDEQGRAVGAAHAGWRGLAGGVIEATVAAMALPPEGLMAWLGPAIGPEVFEVGAEVRQAFLEQDAGADACFRPSPQGRWLADLYELARRRLRRLGVERIYGGGFCTYQDAERFYSYRRDGRTGRMVSLIWLSTSSPVN